MCVYYVINTNVNLALVIFVGVKEGRGSTHYVR